MNAQITQAGNHIQALRAAVLGALSHADPMTCILLRDLVDAATSIEKRLVQIDQALVESGRDGE